MRFFRPWIIIRWLWPDALFRIKTDDRICCLTFDDGPNPGSTQILLDLLDRYHVKALFFCTGKSASEHPGLMSEIRKKGHLTGNHGYEHLDGWKTPSVKYFHDIESSSVLTSMKFFRPPFGRMTYRQYQYLRKFYRIIIWDIMPYDFDKELDPERSAEILKKKLRPGSVIVLHDIPGPSIEITKQFLNQAESAGYSFVLPD